MTQTIHPLILCGGSGTRLWPLSRKSYPKQFTKLTGEESLFQASARRLAGDGYAAPDLPPAGPSLMTRVCRFDFGSRRFRAWQAWQAFGFHIIEIEPGHETTEHHVHLTCPPLVPRS